MKIKKNILFFSCVGDNIGLGHYKRLDSLQKYIFFETFNKNFFVLKIGSSSNSKIKFKANIKNKFTSFRFRKKYDIAFVDISNNYFINNLILTKLILSKIRLISNKLILFDGLGEYNLKNRLNNTKYFDYIISPYSNKSISSSSKVLAGRRYAIIDSSILKYSKHQKINKVAKRIILTFGGSDLNQLTFKLLKILSKINITLDIKIFIGPYFNKKNIFNINKFHKQSNHNVIILRDTFNLASHYSKADLIFVGSGLSKYEVAASGTPQIIISNNNHDEIYNSPFKRNGLKVINIKKNSSSIIIKEIDEIIFNEKLRNKLSNIGKKYIDGKGIERLLKKIL